MTPNKICKVFLTVTLGLSTGLFISANYGLAIIGLIYVAASLIMTIATKNIPEEKGDC